MIIFTSVNSWKGNVDGRVIVFSIVASYYFVSVAISNVTAFYSGYL